MLSTSTSLHSTCSSFFSKKKYHSINHLLSLDENDLSVLSRWWHWSLLCIDISAEMI